MSVAPAPQNTVIAAGTSLAISGNITVVNRGHDEAVVLAAVIGTAVAGEFAP